LYPLVSKSSIKTTKKLAKTVRKRFRSKRLLKLVAGKKLRNSVADSLKAAGKKRGVVGIVAAGLGSAGLALDADDWITELRNDAQNLVPLIRDWSGEKYTDIDCKTILIVAGAIAYFVSPIDIVPDWLPAIDEIDDIAILLLAMHAVRQEVHRYREWKDGVGVEDASDSRTGGDVLEAA